MADHIRFERRGAIGIVTLNRPAALNALTLDMASAMLKQLDDWAGNEGVAAVVVRAEGGRAFCAGGDIRAIYNLGTGAAEHFARHPKEDFFRLEYRLNHRIHHYPKPYIALIDGVTMGGGLGLSVHGSHRVAGERTLTAMPECAIGFFPDIGASWFLNRCPGAMGTWLGLTGTRLGPADSILTGFATHFVPGAEHERLVEALARDAGRRPVSELLGDFVADPGPSTIAAHDRRSIDRTFSAGSPEGIVTALQELGDAWAAAQLAAIASGCPTSVAVTVELLRRARGLDYDEVARMEYRLSQRMIARHDFHEGVRAVLVDKDRDPRWNPARAAEVRGIDLAALFAPLGDRDLRFD